MSFLLILLSLSFTVSNGAYNVIDFGAKPDDITDNKRPFLDAWAKVCGSTSPASCTCHKGGFWLLGQILSAHARTTML